MKASAFSCRQAEDMVPKVKLAATVAFTLVSVLASHQAHGQALGIELHATMNPAAGGMGGVSVARPQDVQSAFTGNPATLTQFRGTQFGFAGGWVEPTINIDNDATLPLAGVSPFEAKSQQPGAALGNIAVTQEFTALGLPVTWGTALISGAGLGVRYMQAPESNGSVASISGLHMASGIGVQVTEKLSAGAMAYVTTAVMDGPFSGLTAATPAYQLRGLLGTTYDAGENTTLGFYWMTKQNFNFQDAVRLNLGGGSFSVVQDIHVGLPQTFGIGVANDRLMEGRLLLASDILYKEWSETDLFGAIWDDQFVLQTGLQYQLNSKVRLRLGYTFAENIMSDNPGSSAGGVVPPDAIADAMHYLQSQFPAINEHRLSGGVGLRNVLPGVDLDLSAGGMFDAEDYFGAVGSGSGVTVESYWIAGGLTWRFGRGACERLPVPDRW
jgi:long-chain fatty acid transport protein